MRKLIFLFFLAGLMISSCSARTFCKTDASVIEPSDSVVAMLGDSVCNVIFHAPEVKMYSIAQPGDTSSVKTEFVLKHKRSIVVEESDSVTVTVDSLFCDTLAFVTPKKLNCPEKAILRFILSGEKMYVAGDNWPSVPFIPENRRFIPISFYMAHIAFIPKPDKESTKRKLQTNILHTMETKSLTKY